MEYDALATDPHNAVLRQWAVASGPSGLAVDTRDRRVVVWSQFDRTLSVIPLVGREPVASLPAVAKAELPRVPASEGALALALGRKLFHTTVDPRISNDGRACASCHPDGRDDALTWATPDGPRQTPMLAGRLASTAPYGWNGAGRDVKEHLGHTFQRLGGSGLSDAELDALIAFATKMQAPEPATHAAPAALVARGAEIFHASETGCASCHDGGTLTDRVAHDVGSKAKADAAPKFDTPSLRFVGGTAPYFHDGRYATLRALLVDTSGEMGHTKQLSQADLAALEAYLRTL
jgi:cytochrome c peroxidase